MSLCWFPVGATPPKFSQTFFFLCFELAGKSMSAGDVLRCTGTYIFEFVFLFVLINGDSTIPGILWVI